MLFVKWLGEKDRWSLAKNRKQHDEKIGYRNKNQVLDAQTGSRRCPRRETAAFERTDSHGCMMLHYACGLRNLPVLQKLLDAGVAPSIPDPQGNTPADWARGYSFNEGEALITRAERAAAPVGNSVPLDALADV